MAATSCLDHRLPLPADEHIAAAAGRARPGAVAGQLRRWGLVAVTAILQTAAAAAIGLTDLVDSMERSVPGPPRIDLTNLFHDQTPVEVTVSAAGFRAPWRTTIHELRSSPVTWQRLHVADWGTVAVPLQREALDRMLQVYSDLLDAPAVWDRMTPYDWDAVPQPVRIVAYQRMVAYWSGFYGVGRRYGLAPRPVAQTLSAIVMSESWFDHRARSTNADGGEDIGLGQASPFARERLRQLHVHGRVDASLSEDDYLNPWMATRFVALWMTLLLDEARGDLAVAVRAYNRGISAAGDRLGDDYLAAVERRLARFIHNRGAPPAWDHLWRRAGDAAARD